MAELEEMEQEELDAELLGVGSDPVPDLDLPTPGTSLPGKINFILFKILIFI